MCLETATKVYKRPSPREVVGYKVLSMRRGGGLTTVPRNFVVKQGVWVKAEPRYLMGYKVGFHVYKNLDEARNEGWFCQRPGYGIYRVKLRRLTAVGRGAGIRFFSGQYVGSDQYVGLEMKVGKRVFPVSHTTGR